MDRSFINALIFFLFMFFIFVAFGNFAKAESYKNYDTTSLANMIWNICKDQSDNEDAFFDCADYYNNCVINKGPVYKDETLLVCIKEKAKFDK